MRTLQFPAAELGFPQSLLMPSVAALGMLWLSMRSPNHLYPEVPIRTPVMFRATLVLPVASFPILLHDLTGSAAALSLGVLVGHLLQEIVHYRLHMATRPVNPWLLERRREHAFHHQCNEHVAYGTLTGFWDAVLGTSVAR